MKAVFYQLLYRGDHSGSCLWISAVLVVAVLTFSGNENDVPDDAGNRDQRDQYPPTALAKVMHTANCNTQTRQQDCQGIKGRNDASGLIAIGSVKNVIQNSGYDHSNKVEQDKHPELFSTSSATENCVFLKNIKIPLHNNFS